MEIKESNLNQIKDKIQIILNKSHKIIEKQKIRLLNGRLNFACPICGDSHSNTKAKRGNLYLSNFQYVCYNGGCSFHRMSFTSFLRHFNENVDLSLTEEILSIENKKNEVSIENIESSLLFDLKEFENLTGFIEYGNFPRIDNYIKLRGLDQFTDRIKIDVKRDGLWILNLIGNKIIGAQFRNFSKFKPKYVSFPWSHIAKFMKKDIKVDGEILEILDRESLIFGLYNININKPITILEGPIDSFFIDNSIAISGLHKINTVLDFFDKEDRRFILDNDSDGLKYSEKLINNGESVFSWNLYLKKNKIVENVKDVNDLFILNQKSIKIDNYFLNNKIDWIINKRFKDE